MGLKPPTGDEQPQQPAPYRSVHRYGRGPDAKAQRTENIDRDLCHRTIVAPTHGPGYTVAAGLQRDDSVAETPAAMVHAMFLRLDDAVLSTVDLGPDDRPLLALNGWSAAWQAWLPTFEIVSRSRRCISYDTRGTGGSQADPNSITLPTLVDDVFRVLDAHGIEQCTLAGESLGGFVALHTALRDPSRFTDLVLVAATSTVPAPAVADLVTGARTDYPATARAFARHCLNEPDSAHLHHWGSHLFLSADPEVAARLFECAYGHDVDLARIPHPTCVLHGDADLVVPVELGRYLADTIPHARFTELPGAGHGPTVTRPAEIAAALA